MRPNLPIDMSLHRTYNRLRPMRFEIVLYPLHLFHRKRTLDLFFAWKFHVD